jgi:hypothetical protein
MVVVVDSRQSSSIVCAAVGVREVREFSAAGEVVANNAPKGQYMTAQGNALGIDVTIIDFKP